MYSWFLLLDNNICDADAFPIALLKYALYGVAFEDTLL